MGFPYSSGDVLTAADLNESSGLVLITTQTVGSGVSSVTVSNAFSSTFYNYRVVLSSMLTSVAAIMRFTFVSQTGNFYGNRLKVVSSATTVTSINTGAGGLSYAEIGLGGTSRQGFVSLDVYSPYVDRRKGITGNYSGSGENGFVGYEENSTNAYTGFVLTPASGVFNGGQIYVYGYNNG
jgi:hypothetical protein